MLRTIGVEEHAWSPELRDALLAHGGDDTVNMIGKMKVIDDQLCEVGEERIAKMDDAGVDMQILSTPPPGVQLLAAAEAVPLAQSTNDFLAAATKAHPERFAAFAALPAAAPDAAAEELERCVSKLGMVGAMLFPRAGDLYLDDERFRPIFEAAAALKVPLYMHPQLPPRAVRDASYSGFSPQKNLSMASGGWGWHLEAGLAALRLIVAGTFDRHPDLQLVLGHWGELLVTFVERVDVLSRAAADLERSVGEYVTGNVLVSAGGLLNHRMLLQTISAVGVDRIFFAQDFPYHPVTDGGSRTFIESAPISPDDKAKIAYGNAARLISSRFAS